MTVDSHWCMLYGSVVKLARQVLEQIKVQKDMDRAALVDVSRTSLRTKVHSDLADLLTEVGVQFYELTTENHMAFSGICFFLFNFQSCLCYRLCYMSAFGDISNLFYCHVQQLRYFGTPFGYVGALIPEYCQSCSLQAGRTDVQDPKHINSCIPQPSHQTSGIHTSPPFFNHTTTPQTDSLRSPRVPLLRSCRLELSEH